MEHDLACSVPHRSGHTFRLAAHQCTDVPDPSEPFYYRRYRAFQARVRRYGLLATSQWEGQKGRRVDIEGKTANGTVREWHYVGNLRS